MHTGKQKWLPCSAQVGSLVALAHRLAVVEFSASSRNLILSAPSFERDCRKPVLWSGTPAMLASQPAENKTQPIEPLAVVPLAQYHQNCAHL